MFNWKSVALALVMGIGSLAGVARAQEAPVLVELFTSQGCSSCPQADALMTELAARDDVIALSLHVDYWDYLGWKDSFGDPAFTKRQKNYAHSMGERMVYTPQMVIAGAEHVIGNKPMKIANAISRASRRPAPVTLEISREGDELLIRAQALQPLTRAAQIQLMRYLPKATVQIERGENAGRTLDYINVVREMQLLGAWDGRREFRTRVAISGDLPVVVLVQRIGPSEVLAAARLR